jgi:hypothetical protein
MNFAVAAIERGLTHRLDCVQTRVLHCVPSLPRSYLSQYVTCVLLGSLYSPPSHCLVLTALSDTDKQTANRA